tara:strand:- start:77 stop:589 length:513 start_codon:yes stop_codon:yes gene_type:complete
LEEILDYVTSYTDYPNKGIVFKDLLGILREPKIFKSLINKMASSQVIKESDAILAIEARGFIFGSAIAFNSAKPLIVARKPNKLPGKLIKKKYALEYGKNTLAIQKKSIEKFHKFCVIDDVLATGGTAQCVSELLTSEGKVITGYNVVVEIEFLKGREKLLKPVISQLQI